MLKKKRNKISKLDKIVNKTPKTKKVKMPKIKKVSFTSTDFFTLSFRATKKGKTGKQAKRKIKEINRQDYAENLIKTYYEKSSENIKRFIRFAKREMWENETIIYFLENFYEEINALETSEEVLNYIKNETIL